MTHFVGLVVANDEEDMIRIVEPYDEQRPAAPYFVEIRNVTTDNWNEWEAMCKLYKTNDPKKLLEYVEDWCGAPGDIIDGKLGYYSTYPTHAKWDWYVVGGRWDDIVPGNQCLAEEVVDHFAKQDYIPAVIVDRKGWHSAKDWGWWGTSTPIEGQQDVVKQKLEEHKGKLVYIVDFHI